MNNSLLLEIGTEEIPASYITPALNALSSTLLKKLTDARIAHGSARVFGTPRRLAVEIADVSDKQESVTTEVMGPPEKVGFDENGKPAVPARKFAEKLGISTDEISIKKTKKGSYLCATKTEEGLETNVFLQGILPDVIRSVPFPKTMKWADLNLQFARPVHWILALLGNDVIPFSLENIKSGNTTRGHRFMSPDTITVTTPGDYIERLRSAYVLADLEERKQIIEKEISKAAQEAGGRVLPDSELVDIVNNLVEYPVPVVGKFDEEFLEVPDEVLITAMREHQKYFAIIDENDKLMSCFIAVNNTQAKNMDLVAAGHGRVIRARLADAQFFYKGDLEASFDDWIEKLKGVLFQAKLGSMYKKIMRVREVAEFISDAAGQDSAVKEQAARAAMLCKADLVSQVVVEFPKLQGVMGRVYAGIKGEPDAVACAIEEHYRPTYSGGTLPETMTGAILAIADKIDSICGCFSAGLIPTGASDPYALRRQGIGIIQIMHEKGFSFSLKAMIEKSATLFGERRDRDVGETVSDVYTFLQNRISHLLAEEGFSKDVIASVTSVSVDNMPNVRNRVRALENLKSAPDFDPLAVAFKRVVNIIRKAGEAGETVGDVDKNLFEHESESALYAAYNAVKNKVSEDLDKGLFDQALLDIASLRDTVDAFFDGVLVMAEDTKIRNNRFALLKNIADLFGGFADFSKIST
ncbi:glycine--tRNA ligase subunit beta [Desulfonema magnum]|uniref:Glycine--tRNA ligase beta subunit n=1 Tax=Desulfonema magnum TaxID=45655 RepID=A0A975GQ35_9BACT|nr:glycine--tRNA ligase subunit beta [Desulfonema magnum]QTA89459.1 Glycyl--tRNA synthetase, subunit beta [Desulfonema magnum]